MAPTPDSLLSPASVSALELDALLAVVAELTATDLGRQRAEELEPFTDETAFRERRGEVEDASRLVPAGPLVGSFDAPLGDLLERLATGRPALTGIDLVRLGDLLRATRAAAGRIERADPPCPHLAARFEPLPDLSELLARLDRSLDRRGDVREDASPLLAELRGRIRGSRDRLYKDLSGFIERHRDDLSEETIPMRGGRLVLVLQAGSRGRIKGLTHGRSGSGKSFYFEPLEVVEANNTLQQAVEDEEAEKQRILLELIAAARRHLDALEAHGDLLGDLDLLQASVRFGERCRGRLVDMGPAGQLRLRGARHPLLIEELADLRELALGHAGHRGEVVPLEIALGPVDGSGDGPADGEDARPEGSRGDDDGARRPRALVITGPNAGGKTVALKTVGLLAAASQCALPVPVAPGSQLPFFGSVVATVGDEQDLLADRSTFSGRLLRLEEAWKKAGPDALILLDELGSGTDPEEGSALAVALLEGLLERRCLAVITTHLTQLAAAALEMPGAGCAAMEFKSPELESPETSPSAEAPASALGEPTYRLLPGPPGSSEALALARRLGLPAAWLDRAEALLGSEHRDLRKMLAEVERVRRELATAQEDADRLRRRLEEDRARLAREQRALEEERKGAAQRMKRDLEQFRQETTRKLGSEVERLREELEAGRRKRLEQEAAERLFEEAPTYPEAEEDEPDGPVEVGSAVRHKLLGWEGTLESLDRGKAEVSVAGKRLRCTEDELVPVEDQASGSAGRSKGKRPKKSGLPKNVVAHGVSGVSGVSGDLAGGGDVPTELHLIGSRVEPALSRLDDYLDRALLGAKASLRIVHGHGSGQLRKAVREHLRGHPAVATQRPGQPDEGGDGATVITLRGA